MADKKSNAKNDAKASTKEDVVKGDELPAAEAKGNEPVEAERAELPMEAAKRERVVDHHTVDAPAPVKVEGEATHAVGEQDPDEVKIAAKQHVQYARKIYKKEPWLVQTVLRDIGPDDTISKADVRERLAVFLGTTVG